MSDSRAARRASNAPTAAEYDVAGREEVAKAIDIDKDGVDDVMVTLINGKITVRPIADAADNTPLPGYVILQSTRNAALGG